MPSRSRLVWITALALVAGCARATEPTRPAPAARAGLETSASATAAASRPGDGDRDGDEGPDRVPLAVGNRWVYARTYRLTAVPPDGPPRVVFLATSVITTTLGCLDTTAAAVYAFQNSIEIQHFDNYSTTSVSWIDLRQDAKGLYEYYPPPGTVPSCVEASPPVAGPGLVTSDPGRLAALATRHLPAGLAPAASAERLAGIAHLAVRTAELERTRGAPGQRGSEWRSLAYPLRPGQSWSYDDPTIRTTVEARVTGLEVCNVPAGTWKAARVEQVWVGRSGPEDTIESWYGSVGLLRYHYRLVTGDPGTTRFITENDQVLKQVRLTAPPHQPASSALGP